MHDLEKTIAALGNEPPLTAGGRSGPPDRREISTRWLSGTFLTGVTSTVLMGVALMAALDGREQLATPPELAEIGRMVAASQTGEAAKAGRVAIPRVTNRARDRRRMEVSTVTRVGDRDVVRTVPFVEVRMALAAGHATTRNYPAFDPLTVFAEEGAAQPATSMGLIYGARVESEVSLRTIDFPVATAAFDDNAGLSADEVEQVVRSTGAILTGDGDFQVAALHYVDPQRFGDSSLAAAALAGSYGVRIIQENVSVARRAENGDGSGLFSEEIIPVRADRPVADILADAGYDGDDAGRMTEALARLRNGTTLRAGTVLRLGVEVRADASRLARASIYDKARHVLSIAVDDRGQFVLADEPEPHAEVVAAFDNSRPAIRARGDLPRIYDGIFRAAYSYGMSRQMTQQLIKLLAADVDFQARVGPSDRLEVLFTNPEDDDRASDESELLYVKASFGGNVRTFYRFQLDEGAVDFFDQDGRSARQFLLRNPIPNGRFRSGFGMRRHPILGYSKMHTGVDWSAPRGTPIIASGNGTVEKSGWEGGYGRQTIIRHANGYQTSYSHQSAIAKGVVPGAKVRQGQVIGYVGATGLATGNHLHYELIVNGNKVDPMRVRLPTGRVLKDAELQAFNRERERIDALLADDSGGTLKVASR